MPKLRIEHDVNECIGCGACEAVCPEFFEMVQGSEFKAHLKGSKKVYEKETLETNDAKNVKEAIDSCPVTCIHLFENNKKIA